MEQYAFLMGAGLVLAAGVGFMLFLDFQKSEKKSARQRDKRVDQRARFSQLAATEAAEKKGLRSSRKDGFGRR